jgi:glycerol-3-phosphate acyltransferase PlsY
MAMSKDADSVSASLGVVVVVVAAVVVVIVVVWFSILSLSACDKVQMARDTVSVALLLVVQNTSKSSSGGSGGPFPVAALRLANTVD